MGKHEKDLRNPNHPLRRAQDYNSDGTRRRKWSKPERKYRLSYRRRPVATITSTVAAVLASATIAYAGSQVPSIFQNTEYDGSGWNLCEGPISWTLDDGQNFQWDLQWAFDQWEKSGYKFVYGGKSETTFDDQNSRLDTVAQINRNIAITFLPDRQSTMLTKNVVGFAGPSMVFKDARSITGAYVVFQQEYSLAATQKERRALFLHEIGHALGLADSQDPTNVMYWTVKKNTNLSEGELRSVTALQKGCSNG